MFLELIAFAQGSWDIGYTKVDSIKSIDIGKIVQIDFKHQGDLKEKRNSWSIRDYVVSKDTGKIILDGKKEILFERRRIYVDHGSFNDQYLEIKSEDNGYSKRIYYATLLKIERDRLKFSVNIETFVVKEEQKGIRIKTEVKEIWIDRKDLDGLMTQI